MRRAGLPTLAIGRRINPYEYRCQLAGKCRTWHPSPPTNGSPERGSTPKHERGKAQEAISISRAYGSSSTSVPNSASATTTTKAPRLTTTAAHHETRIAPAFGEQLRELL